MGEANVKSMAIVHLKAETGLKWKSEMEKSNLMVILNR